MKNLLASAALLVALSACSQEAEEPAAPAEEVVEAPAAPTMESYVGDWNVTTSDGQSYVASNGGDGSYKQVMADGTEATGTWTFGVEQSCWTMEGEEETCYTITPEDAAGTVTGTPVVEGGPTFTATRVVMGGEPAAEEAAPADAG